jgi:serine phosphatase RsbU (regulator of sigma subunit)
LVEALSGARQLVSVTLDSTSRDVICVPLVALPTLASPHGPATIGVIYLDCPQQTVVPQLNLELLHMVAMEAFTVLENANALEHERQRILLDQELELARKIQQNLLPREFPTSGWIRAAGSSLPSLEVSGDYFDLHRIDDDNWAAVIADVSGKGVSSALLSSLLQGALLLGSDLDVSLDKVMTKINGFLVDRAQREKYATLFYATVHSSGILEWVNAGHCAPYVISVNGRLQQLQTTGMPLGLWRNTHYTVERVQLAHADKILAFSDGISEAENAEGEPFERYLPRLLKQCGGLSAQELHDRVIAETLAYHEQAKQRDDITALVLEFCGIP